MNRRTNEAMSAMSEPNARKPTLARLVVMQCAAAATLPPWFLLALWLNAGGPVRENASFAVRFLFTDPGRPLYLWSYPLFLYVLCAASWICFLLRWHRAAQWTAGAMFLPAITFVMALAVA
jgi:hypothetical protein